MTFTESLAARRIYELECQREERTFARDHSFEEWVQWTGIGENSQSPPGLALSGFTEEEVGEIVRGYVKRQST